jgi:AcrR family transcriptional regulator
MHARLRTCQDQLTRCIAKLAQRRKYELKKRAERLEETRRRITEATVELHATVGPAATKISEIARRAGVERVTVYNHFPDDISLLTACSQHWRALHPAPDPSAWVAIPDPGERLRAGLGKLYAWYRETEPMMANVQRDAESLPALKAVLDGGLGPYLEAVRGILAAPIQAEGRTGERVKAATRAATSFHLWRSLSGLGDEEAADLAAKLVEAAAGG